MKKTSLMGRIIFIGGKKPNGVNSKEPPVHFFLQTNLRAICENNFL